MKHILVIEDDIAYQKLIHTALTREGFTVEAVSDGEEGCRIFDETSYDLVITDIFMPEKEGFETIMELREKSDRVKIIAISGGGQFNGLDMLPMALELGADAILEKPIDIKELIEKINELLNY